MTPQQRGAAANLMYLCGDHHDVIDSQIESHPAELLHAMKAEHEARVRRAVRSSIGHISYQSLEVVCTVVAASGGADGPIALPLPVREKIELNRLGDDSIQLIEEGLAQAHRVQAFLAFQAAEVPEFGRRLVARFRSDYEEAVASGLTADDIFEFVKSKAVENAGSRGTPEILAAAVSVVAYMFEICEIFEHE